MKHAKYKSYSSSKRSNKAVDFIQFIQQWLPSVLLGLVLLFLIKGWSFLDKPSVLPFSHIKIEAPGHHVQGRVLYAAVKRLVRAGFFSLDIDDFRAKLMAQLPWVKAVDVRRIWPDHLKIVIHEKSAIAQWNHDALLTPEGVLFSPNKDTYPKGLVQLNGAESSLPDILQQYTLIRDLLGAIGLKVASLTKTDRGAWHVTLVDGVSIMLGRKDIEQRLKRFVYAYPRVIANAVAPIKRVDLRYPNGFSIAWSHPAPTY